MSKAISDIKKSVVTVTTAVKKKTKEIAEIAKLKIDIKMEESSLDHCFESLGRAVYAHSVTGKNEEKVQKLIAKAGAICKKIKEYKSRLAFIEDKEVCPHCEAVIERGFPCSYCQEKIVITKKEKNTENVEKTDPVDDFSSKNKEE